jgi:hypothetical protein
MKNFKVIYLACICFFFFNTSYATEMRWRVSGQIFEYQTNEALPYVSVSLKSRADSSLITGTISDEQGMFEFNKIEKGDYFMEFSFMGFESHGIEQITFTEGAPQVNLGNIFMHPAAMLLDGVEVKSKMSSIGQMIDRQVINVERNPFSTGGTAIDALKLSPSVQVDGDGKIKLRGSSSFTVLING